MRPPWRRGLEWYFEHNDGHLIDKWVHYFDVYERHFEEFRGRRPTVLELGVFHGGSLEMWRWYFGRGSTIVGVDIEERASRLDDPENGIHVVIGSQSDPDLLRSLVERHGPFDIVIDDASHRSPDQSASLAGLWDGVVDGGVYLVEDVHTSYLAEYDGGVGREDTFIGETKRLIDEVNGDWHPDVADPLRGAGASSSPWTRTLAGVHVYDSIVVLDRRRREPPVRRQTGRPAFDELFGRPTDEMISDDHRAQLERLNRPMARLRRTLRDPSGAWSRVRARFE